MELICYPLLNTRSKRAILRTRKRWGSRKYYVPRGDLLERLGQELNMTTSQVAQQLNREREWLLRHKKYFL